MHDEGKRRSARMRWLVDRHVKPLYETLSGLLQRDKERGAVAFDVEPVHFFYAVAGAGLIFHQAEECKRLSGIDPFDSQVVE